MGKIVLFMGASSSGKDTIQKYILKNNAYNLQNIVMHTTRPIRVGEVNGREYYFDTEEEMSHLEKSGQIVECRKYNTIYGPWYYYTTTGNIDLDNNNYLGSNTLEGLTQYLKHYSVDDIVSVLFKVDDGIRLSRAIEREMSEEKPKYAEVCRRFLADCEDFSLENIKKLPITEIVDNNGCLEETVEKLEKVLKKNLTK